LADHDQDETAAGEPGRPDPLKSGPGAGDDRRGDDGSTGADSLDWSPSGLAGPRGWQPPFGTRASSAAAAYPQRPRAAPAGPEDVYDPGGDDDDGDHDTADADGRPGAHDAAGAYRAAGVFGSPGGYGAGVFGSPGGYDTAGAYGPPGGYDTAEFYDPPDDYDPGRPSGPEDPQATPYPPAAPDARSWPQQMSYARAQRQEPLAQADPPVWQRPVPDPPADQSQMPYAPAEPPAEPGVSPGPTAETSADQRIGFSAGLIAGSWAEPQAEPPAELHAEAQAEAAPESFPPPVRESPARESPAREPSVREVPVQEPALPEPAIHQPPVPVVPEAIVPGPVAREPAVRLPGELRTSETADSLTADVLLRGRHKAPSGGWRRALYRGTGGLIRAPQSAAEMRRRELITRARTPVSSGHYRVAVVSLKGGVGKTTTTVGLGATLASVRGDRVIAVDANPDRGTLSDKLRLETAATVRDLLNERDQIERYADVRSFTTQAPSRLEVLASDRDPTVSVAFSDQDYYDVAQVLEHYYSICLADCGTGLLHSAMAGVLHLADQIVLVCSPSVDGARSASATLDWLQAHGYGDLVRQAVVVLSVIRPRSKSTVDMDRLEQHFAARSRAVVRIPYDPHLEEGAEVDLAQINRATADAYLALAAEVGDGFARPRRAARPAPARN
jgi:MinD-like ATPase involved in chromosome partitioning or flagellar assembly